MGNRVVKCTACYQEGQRGICGIRHNYRGKLCSLVNCRPCSVAYDPIEKKPLYHFYPGTTIYSIGTVGCNMRCDFCQNWTISQTPKGSRYDLSDVVRKLQSIKLTPQQAVSQAQRRGCNSIAYTYNEPTVFADFILSTAQLAHSKGIKNVLVTNGYQSLESILSLSPFVDAVNIDLKSFSNGFYSKLTGVRLEPILRNIRIWLELGVWVEVTTLLIPGENDSDEEIEQIARYLVGLDSRIVWHLSAYYDAFRMSGKGQTPLDTLKRAYVIGKKAGLSYIYLGNVSSAKHSTTFCCACGTKMVDRGDWGRGGKILKGMVRGKCKKCSEAIPGIWSDEVDQCLRKKPANEGERKAILAKFSAVKKFDRMELDGRRSVVILFATQTGVSEEYAHALRAWARRHLPNCDARYEINVVDMRKYDEVASLAAEDVVIVVTSTFFYGRIPRNGERFLRYLRALNSEGSPQDSVNWTRGEGDEKVVFARDRLKNVKYAVFGIGSTGTKPEHLKTYQVIAREIDMLMEKCGGSRVCKIGEANKRKDFIQTLEMWKRNVWESIEKM